MIFFLRNRIGLPGKATFSKRELSLILSLYGARVKNGEWRDYAIDCMQDMAVFSIFRSSKEAPAYTVAKIQGRGLLRPPQYTVCAGDETLRQGASLSDVLEVFDRI